MSEQCDDSGQGQTREPTAAGQSLCQGRQDQNRTGGAMRGPPPRLWSIRPTDAGQTRPLRRVQRGRRLHKSRSLPTASPARPNPCQVTNARLRAAVRVPTNAKVRASRRRPNPRQAAARPPKPRTSGSNADPLRLENKARLVAVLDDIPVQPTSPDPTSQVRRYARVRQSPAGTWACGRSKPTATAVKIPKLSRATGSISRGSASRRSPRSP